MAGLLSTPRQEHSSGATLQDIDTNALASTRLNQILNSNSDLMKTSMTRGLQTANQRGLLNSTFAAEAGAKAMIDSATPIAQMDSTNTANQSLANQRYINEFGLQNDQQDWQSGENALDRGHDITLQGNDQRWQSGENSLDRTHDFDIQKNDQTWKSGENSLDRTHDFNVMDKEQTWKSGENSLDRYENRWLQKDQQGFLKDQNEFDWYNKRFLQDDQQEFDKGQNEYDWGQKFDYQDSQNVWQSGENTEDRKLTQSEGDANRQVTIKEGQANRDLSKSEGALDRAHDTSERVGTQEFNLKYLDATTKNQLTVQQDAQQWEKAMQDNKNLHELDMFDRGERKDVMLANLNGAIESGLIDQQAATNIAGNLANSLDRINSNYTNQVFSIMNNASMDADTKDKYIGDMYGYYEAPKFDENGEPVLDEDGNQVMDRVSAETEGATRVKGLIDYEIEDVYAIYNDVPELASAYRQSITGGA